MKRAIRWLIESATHSLCHLKRHKRYSLPSAQKPVRVNLGCGLAVALGWINVDGSLNALIASWPRILQKMLYRVTGAKSYYSLNEYLALLGDHVFLHHDLSYGIPLPDNSVDFIYTSHFIEHLHKKDAAHLIAESYRVLKPGGIARICIPDLAYAVSQYQAGNKAKMLDSYFFVDEESYFAQHKYMYDFDLLDSVLRAAGFSKIDRCSFRQGITPDINILDNRPDDTLFVEAIKHE